MRIFLISSILIWKIFLFLFLSLQLETLIIAFLHSTHYQSDSIAINIGEWLLLGLSFIIFVVNAIPATICFYLPLPKDFLSVGIITIIVFSINYIMLYYEKYAAAKAKEHELNEKIKQEEIERKIREEEMRKAKEIVRRKDIVINILNNLYKNTEREVNKTLIPTLINELYDIYIGLHSDNLNELIIYGNTVDFQNIINSIESELQRLQKLAIDAQKIGYNEDENDYSYSDRSNGQMTKERAFEIFGLKQTSTKEEINRAYRELAKKYHTDINNRAEYEDHVKQMLDDKMKELNNANDFLKIKE